MSHILLDLGTQPLVGNLCLSKEESLHVKKYPLRAHYNKDLKINLDTEIEPRILYEKYLYHSGVSKPYIKHCEDIYSSFKHLKSKTVSIKHRYSNLELKLHFNGFPYLGIWTQPKQPGNFICLEPWFGITDSKDSSDEFSDKEGRQIINPKQHFKATYAIEVI